MEHRPPVGGVPHLPEAEVRVRRHAQQIGQEARTLPPKPGVALSHHQAFTPMSSVLFLYLGWMLFGSISVELLIPWYGLHVGVFDC